MPPEVDRKARVLVSLLMVFVLFLGLGFCALSTQVKDEHLPAAKTMQQKKLRPLPGGGGLFL